MAPTISSIFNLKFKAQLNDSPIIFDNFLLIKNLITENENYVIVFQSEKEVLKFKDRNEFIINFIKLIDEKLYNLEKEFETLNEFVSNSMGIKYDENEVYLWHEHIGHNSFKLNQIRNKLIKLKL